MEAYVENIREELQVEFVQIGGLTFHEATIATFMITTILLILGFVLTRGFRVENPSRRQLAVESFVLWLRSFYGNILGEHGKDYVTYMMSIACYIAVANAFFVFGIKPPTKDLTVTAALAFMTIILVQVASIRKKGIRGWLHGFIEPVPVMLFMNLLELFIKPVSLCMRLFGNVLGAFIIMCLIEGLVKIILPVPFSLYFDFFDGLIQVYVFTFLSSMYISEAVE